MNGILLIHKPQGFTSFDVVAKMRGIAHTRKIGHSGTLDPMATGVLPLLIGNATKACDILPIGDKSYLAGFALGFSTDTQDSTGAMLTKSDIRVTRGQLEAVLPQFTGDIMQIPPMYSAVSIGGKRLYELARQGIEVERAARPITVYECKLLSFDEQTQSGTLSITCSKGSYVRTICHDIGNALGCGGVMTSLCRTMAAGFLLEQCITLEQADALSKQEKLIDKLIDIEQAFMTYPLLALSDAQIRLYKNGIKLDLARVPLVDETTELYRIHDTDGSFLGLAKCRFETKELIHYKNFAVH